MSGVNEILRGRRLVRRTHNATLRPLERLRHDPGAATRLHAAAFPHSSRLRAPMATAFTTERIARGAGPRVLSCADTAIGKSVPSSAERLPARSISRARVTRRSRVSWRLASPTQRAYSLRWVKAKASKAAFAAGSPARAL